MSAEGIPKKPVVERRTDQDCGDAIPVDVRTGFSFGLVPQPGRERFECPNNLLVADLGQQIWELSQVATYQPIEVAVVLEPAQRCLRDQQQPPLERQCRES